MDDKNFEEWLKKMIDEKFNEISPGSGYWNDILRSPGRVIFGLGKKVELGFII